MTPYDRKQYLAHLATLTPEHPLLRGITEVLDALQRDVADAGNQLDLPGRVRHFLAGRHNGIDDVRRQLTADLQEAQTPPG